MLSRTWGSPARRSVDVRLGGSTSECRLQEIKIAALVGLLDMAAEHPPLAPLISPRRRVYPPPPAHQVPLGHLRPDFPSGRHRAPARARADDTPHAPPH